MKKCTKCGLPMNYPGIRFNEAGECNYCNFYHATQTIWEDPEKREGIFRQEIQKAKAQARESGSEYDCIVGLSGGKDSMYVVYQLKKLYNLRVLTFTFDNGFSTDFGKRNLEIALDKLDVDHISIRMNERQLRKLYQVCVKMMKNFCSVCFHFMHYYSHLLAKQYHIPLAVNGRTKGQILQSAADQKGIEPFDISRNLLDFEYQMFGPLAQKLDSMGKVDYLKEVSVTSLSYFAYHDVTDQEKMELLERELGWIRPEAKVPHADCWAHPMAEYFSLAKRGYPVRTGELAVEVRMNQLSLKEAQKLLQEDASQYEKPEEELEKRFYERIRPKGEKRWKQMC